MSIPYGEKIYYVNVSIDIYPPTGKFQQFIKFTVEMQDKKKKMVSGTIYQ
jgi:hypothetical protein